MKKILTLTSVLLLITSQLVNAQNDSIFDIVDIEELGLKDNHNIYIYEKEPVFVIVEQMPSFPGGESEMQRFVSNNLKYPQEAIEKGIQGRVIVRFVVGSTGKICDPRIVRGISNSLDDEAIRVVETMPKWTPGKQNGREVAVYYTLPIMFQNTQSESNNHMSYERLKDKFQYDIAHNPQVAEIYFDWGNRLFGFEKYDEAIEQYKKTLEINPDYADAYINWGAMLNAMEKYGEAISKYEKAIEIDPNSQNIHLYNNWGSALSQIKRGGEAMDKFEKAIEIEPDFQTAYYNWGIAYNIMEKYEEAILKFEHAAKIDSTYGDAYFRWGESLMKIKDYDLAQEKYSEALEKGTSFKENALYNIGWILQQQNKQEDAINYFTETLSINPENVNGYYAWAHSLVALKRNKEAIEKYEKAIEIDPEHLDSYFAYANLLYDMGKKKQAKKLYLKRGEIEAKKNPRILHAKAIKKFNESVRMYGTRISLFPDMLEAYSDWNEELKKLKAENAELYPLVVKDFEERLEKNKERPNLKDTEEFQQIYNTYFKVSKSIE